MNSPQRKRNKISPSSYHGSGSDYRNIAIPNTLHKRLSHIAIDLEVSNSEIVSMLLEEFCMKAESGAFSDFYRRSKEDEEERNKSVG